jgi:SOS response regulatory protein OraA/RecX
MLNIIKNGIVKKGLNYYLFSIFSIFSILLIFLLFNSNIVLSQESGLEDENDNINHYVKLLENITKNGLNIVYYTDDLYSFDKINLLSCHDDINHKTVKNSLYCYDNFQTYTLKSYLWDNNCSISVYDASKPYCSSAKLISEFKTNELENIRYTKDVSINQILLDPKNVLSKQRWDGGFQNPIDTAVAIWLLSDFNDLYSLEMENALEWLKVNRNDRDKCWPSSSCSSYETAVVLAYLTLAGLDDTNKVYYDGRIWLENHQNFIEGSDWNIYLSTNSDNNCTLEIGSSITEIDEFNSSVSQSFNLNPDYGLEIDLSCDSRVSFSIHDERNLSIFSSHNSRNVNFKFPNGACWSNQQWKSCNDMISVYATIVELSTIRKEAAKKYLIETLADGNFIGKYIVSGDSILHSALYYHYINPEPLVAEYLVFRQNNDGSYGSGSVSEIAVRTMHVLNALKFKNLPFTREPVSDSLKWLFTKDPLIGFNDVLADTLVYFTLKNDEINTLYLENEIFDISNEEEIILSNLLDKNYNITLSLVGDINKAIEIQQINSLDAFSNLMIQFNNKEINAGIYSGFLIVYNTLDEQIDLSDDEIDLSDDEIDEINYADFEILSIIPLQYTNSPSLDFEVVNEINVLGTLGKINLKNLKTNSNFNCDAKFENNIEDLNFEIKENKAEINIKLLIEGRNTFLSEGTIICKANNDNDFIFEKDFEILIEQYPYLILDILEEEILINKRSDIIKLTLQNLLDENIEVKIELGILSHGFIVLETNNLFLSPLEQKEVSIFNTIEKKTDLTFDDEIIIKVIDQELSIPLKVNVIYVPFFKSKLFKTIMYISIILIFLILIKVIYYYSDDLKKNLNENKSKFVLFFDNKLNKIKQSLPQSIKDKLHIEDPIEEDVIQNNVVDHSGVESLIKIMMSLNHEEKDIIKRLRKEGLSEDEISESLNMVNEELETQHELEREESIIKVIKKMDEDSDTVRSFLKQSGFSDEQINQAFEEIEEELSEKEKRLEEHLAKYKEVEDETEEVSLLDIEKNKAKDE